MSGRNCSHLSEINDSYSIHLVSSISCQINKSDLTETTFVFVFFVWSYLCVLFTNSLLIFVEGGPSAHGVVFRVHPYFSTDFGYRQDGTEQLWVVPLSPTPHYSHWRFWNHPHCVIWFRKQQNSNGPHIFWSTSWFHPQNTVRCERAYFRVFCFRKQFWPLDTTSLGAHNNTSSSNFDPRVLPFEQELGNWSGRVLVSLILLGLLRSNLDILIGVYFLPTFSVRDQNLRSLLRSNWPY